MATPTPSRPRAQNLADSVYQQLKSELFEFQLLPGDRFTEGEVADRTGASRTPVRQALYRLQREGFLAVNFRNGWEVLPLDFDQLDALYDLRILLEQTSMRRMENLSPDQLHRILLPLELRWKVPPHDQKTAGRQVAAWDEEFHCSLVAASGNSEFVRVHAEVTDRIRIVRRLDFTQQDRVTATYREHASMLAALRDRAFADAADQLGRHIESSRVEARKLTLLRLQSARQNLAGPPTSHR
ncbi:MAG: GntR family transcriptional regulator [Acidobacteriota bacterium]